MGRMSARFIGIKLGKKTADIYNVLEQKNFVVKGQFGTYNLTEEGRKIGGKMSIGSPSPTPTFDFDTIKKEFEK